MELLKPVEAARELGISYPTLKQWIYQGKVESMKTPGGHHRIPRSEVERLASEGRSTRLGPRRSGGMPAISGRNRLRGRVTDVRYEGLLAQVQIDIGDQKVTSIITKIAAQELGLRPGVTAAALIKATEVMVIRE